MTVDIKWIIAFGEGVASFLSPCILALLPVYLSYIVGGDLEEIANKPKAYKKIMLNTLAFIIGFSLVFISLGMTATLLGRFIFYNRILLRKLSGGIIIVFGLYHAGIIKIPFLNREKRMQPIQTTGSAFQALLFGIIFSFGWTPCIGPILGSIIALASSSDTLGTAFILLGAYSLGLALPFMIIASSFKYTKDLFKKIMPYLKTIQLISGLILVVMGILIYNNYLLRILNIL